MAAAAVGCRLAVARRRRRHPPSRTCPAPATEGVVRGYKLGLLTTADYNNLCQCETLEDIKLYLVGAADAVPLLCVWASWLLPSPCCHCCRCSATAAAAAAVCRPSHLADRWRSTPATLHPNPPAPYSPCRPAPTTARSWPTSPPPCTPPRWSMPAPASWSQTGGTCGKTCAGGGPAAALLALARCRCMQRDPPPPPATGAAAERAAALASSHSAPCCRPRAPPQAGQPLARFLDYCTYGHMIDNVVLIVTGTLHERDVQVRRRGGGGGVLRWRQRRGVADCPMCPRPGSAQPTHPPDPSSTPLAAPTSHRPPATGAAGEVQPAGHV